MIKQSDREALSLFNNGCVFKVYETDRLKYFVCKGSAETSYNITFDKLKKEFSCTCKNIRKVKCKHIKACELVDKK